MKFLCGVALISISLISSAAEINYKELSDRFVTSVKEAQVDNQFLGLPQVQECVKKYPIPADMKQTAEIQAQQKKAADCMRSEFAKVSEADLTNLSEKLQLDAFGVVKGKSNAALVDYLSSRLEKALYGQEGGKVKKIGQQKIVDQKVFVDIYETQLGKNILLEISNYCYKKLYVSGGTDRLVSIANLDPRKLKEQIEKGDISDDSKTLIGALDDDEKVYDNISTSLKPLLGNEPAETGAAKLGTLFINCAIIIPKLCEYYESCNCLKNKNTPGAPSCNDDPSKIQCKDPISTRGQHSCHVAARLRGYRANLTAVDATQKSFDEHYKTPGGNSNLSFTTGELKTSAYNKGSAKSGETVDDLTSFTTSEADKAFNSDKMKTEIDGIEVKDCENKPEDPNCEKFFYNKDEVRRFTQSTAGFTAATIVESAKIDKLKQEDLEGYLKNRGYLDLIEKLKAGTPHSDIINAARSRFEAEREATYQEMTAAFDRKQLVTGNPTGKAEEAKKEFQNKGKDFQQLILFNNVVSSYLSVQKLNDKGDLEDAGRNSKAFDRELKSVKDGGNSLEYFQNLSKTNEVSQIQDGETPLVDVNFLDAILGNKKAQSEEDAKKQGNGYK